MYWYVSKIRRSSIAPVNASLCVFYADKHRHGGIGKLLLEFSYEV
jgi:hypothetical protein